MKVNSEESVTRRDFVAGAVATAATFASASAIAGGHKDGEHDHHHHHGKKKNTGLIDSAVDCTTKGKLCREHCIELVKKGDTSIADCLEVVEDTIAMCETLTQLAVSSSPHLPAFASVCISICEDCEKECERHKDKHPECNACMESCANCIKELKKIAA